MFETYIVRCDYDDESTAARRKIWWGKVNDMEIYEHSKDEMSILEEIFTLQ